MQVQWISAILIFYSHQGHVQIPQAKAIQSACSPPIFPLMYFSVPLKAAVTNISLCYQQPFRNCTALIYHPTENSYGQLHYQYTPISKTTGSLPYPISHNRKCCAEPFLFQWSCVYHPFSFNQLGWQRQVFPKECSVAFGDAYPPLTQLGEQVGNTQFSTFSKNQIK